VPASAHAGGTLIARSPIDRKELARLPEADAATARATIGAAAEAFSVWRIVPAPMRGELVRLFWRGAAGQ
jgi:aldehyde dehydrogenase (NAD+)